MSTSKHRAGLVFAGSTLVNLAHSLLAALPVKNAVRRAVGERRFRGLYRAGYNASAVLSYGLGALWFLHQPDRELYRLRGPWALLARAAQLAGVLFVLDIVRVVGLLRISGLRPLLAMLAGRRVPATPEGQGPPPDAPGMAPAGSFRFTRHPDAWPFFLIFWGWPRMTANRAALAASFTAYTLLGVLHEESRMRAVYGADYARYQRTVPFLFPRATPAAAETSRPEPRPRTPERSPRRPAPDVS